MKYEYMVVKTTDHIRRITINRPSKKNAMNKVGYEELTHALNEAARDENVKVCVLTGAGDFYSSGNDLSQDIGDATMEEVRDHMKIMISSLVRAFYTFPKLLMAVVNGPAIGITATTAALCDVVYCSDTAYFRTPFADLGLCSEGCSSYTFPRIMGPSMASSMLYLNHQMTPQEALSYHLVSKVYKKADEQKVWDEISKYSSLPMSSIKAIKSLGQKWNGEILEKVNTTEMDKLAELFMSQDQIDAMMRFYERKRSKL